MINEIGRRINKETGMPANLFGTSLPEPEVIYIDYKQHSQYYIFSALWFHYRRLPSITSIPLATRGMTRLDN
jgi:hypothetical protein